MRQYLWIFNNNNWIDGCGVFEILNDPYPLQALRIKFNTTLGSFNVRLFGALREGLLLLLCAYWFKGIRTKSFMNMNTLRIREMTTLPVISSNHATLPNMVLTLLLFIPIA